MLNGDPFWVTSIWKLMPRREANRLSVSSEASRLRTPNGPQPAASYPAGGRGRFWVSWWSIRYPMTRRATAPAKAVRSHSARNLGLEETPVALLRVLHLADLHGHSSISLSRLVANRTARSKPLASTWASGPIAAITNVSPWRCREDAPGSDHLVGATRGSRLRPSYCALMW